jgi:hypothetical protein
MKKNIIILLAITFTGFMSSCTKDNSVKPAKVTAQKFITADKTDVGQAD